MNSPMVNPSLDRRESRGHVASHPREFARNLPGRGQHGLLCMKSYQSFATGMTQNNWAQPKNVTGAYRAGVSAIGVALATLLLAAVATAAPADSLQDRATEPVYEFISPSRTLSASATWAGRSSGAS